MPDNGECVLYNNTRRSHMDKYLKTNITLSHTLLVAAPFVVACLFYINNPKPLNNSIKNKMVRLCQRAIKKKHVRQHRRYCRV